MKWEEFEQGDRDMDVYIGRGAAVCFAVMMSLGCMNPGYQTLHPPGFSSTALKVQEHRRGLTEYEFAQLTGEQIPSEGESSADRESDAERESDRDEESRASGASWSRGYQAFEDSKRNAETARRTSPEPPALSERSRFSGWTIPNRETIWR